MTLNRMLKQIKDMHKKFGISCDKIAFSNDEKMFRIKCLTEEVAEYSMANEAEDELDALVDLVVFALGTAERQGRLNVFEEAFNRVMACNMQKEVGPNAKRDSFALDLVKPKGFKPADLSDLVKEKVKSQLSLFDYIQNK